jgi:hypothetical protein
MKILTIFRITSGSRSKFYSNRRVFEFRNKLFEEDYWQDFLKLVSVFKEASQDFIFYFLQNKTAKKLKTIGA